MKIEDLTDGLYVATCDVMNPHPDGRKRRDWTAEPLWRAGEQYTVRTWVDDAVNRERPTTWVEISRPGGYVRGSYWPGGRASSSTGAVALARSLEPVSVSTVAQALAATRRPSRPRTRRLRASLRSPR